VAGVAQEIREFAVTIPAGTPKTAPVTTPVVFPSRIVTAVSWRVPPGPSGQMGWALTSAGAPVIPIQSGTYVVTDDRSDTWELKGYLDSGNWAVTGYNTGVYPHTVYLTFQLDLPGSPESPSVPSPGVGVGVIGVTGTVTQPSDQVPPPVPSVPPATDDTAAVAATVLAVLLPAAGGGG